jgi:hypothetical protein
MRCRQSVTSIFASSCRHIAKQQLCKQTTVQQQLLGNSSVDTSTSNERIRNDGRGVSCAVRAGTI